MERYEAEPYQKEMEVEILAAGEIAAGAPAPAPYFVDLAETLLFPGGGGQPADQGELVSKQGKTEVLASEKQENGLWRHYLNAPASSQESQVLKLDWARRFDLMQQHSAQHAISALAQDRFGWRTTAFHLGDAMTDIELDVTEPNKEELEELEQAVAEVIRASLPVRTRRVEKEEYATLKVRSRGLPAGHQGSIRLVEIEGIDLNTCGGTHVRSTAEIEMVKFLGSEKMRGGTRLYWVAGGRVKKRLEASESRNYHLRRLLDTGDDDLVSVLEIRLENLAELKRAKERLELRLAEAEAEALGEKSFAERHFEEGDLAYLQKVAKHWQAGSAGGTLFLTAGKEGEAAFLIATRGETQLDLKKLGQDIAAKLEGRGGGAGRLFQGKAASLRKREEAVALLA